MFAPKLCKKSAAVWTLIVGIVILALWQFVPATHIVSHPIYLEWIFCVATFLIVGVIDRRPATITQGQTLVST